MPFAKPKDKEIMTNSKDVSSYLGPGMAENGQSQPPTSPSQCPFPVFALCQPFYVDTEISNNAWMNGLNGDEKEIDKEKFMAEWFNFYKLLAFNAVVYLIPPKKGLQDQTYVNCAAYLPHYEEKDTIILSNFTAKGRAGEETVAGNFFKSLGYDVIRCPEKFEGEPELKYLRENIYFGGYGFRTSIEAHRWIEKNYGAEIIPVKETDEHLYHLDCTIFVLDKENIMACTKLIDPKTIKQIEGVSYIHDISESDCHEGATNSVRVEDFVLNSSSLEFYKKREAKYSKEYKKINGLKRSAINWALKSFIRR